MTYYVGLGGPSWAQWIARRLGVHAVVSVSEAHARENMWKEDVIRQSVHDLIYEDAARHDIAYRLSETLS